MSGRSTMRREILRGLGVAVAAVGFALVLGAGEGGASAPGPNGPLTLASDEAARVALGREIGSRPAQLLNLSNRDGLDGYTASADSRRFAARRFRTGIVRCGWQIPETARGTRLTGSVSATTPGTARRRFVGKVW